MCVRHIAPRVCIYNCMMYVVVVVWTHQFWGGWRGGERFIYFFPSINKINIIVKTGAAAGRT